MIDDIRQPVPQAEISATYRINGLYNSEIIARATADENGQARLEFTAPPETLLKVSAEGHFEESIPLPLDDRFQLTLAVCCRFHVSAARMYRPFSVHITLSRPGFQDQHKTGSSVTFEPLRPGTYTVLAEHPDLLGNENRCRLGKR